MKCLIFSIAIFSHSYPSFVHLLTASYFFVVLLNSLIVFEPQEGQESGKINFFDFLSLFFKSTNITCGITSPALSIFTVSPILISFLSISSSLWSVALETTTPPIFTGFILATGVKAPVLPTWTLISVISEYALSAENLWAIAHLGEFEVKPNLFWSSKLLILYTKPSTSYSKLNLSSSNFLWKFSNSLIFFKTLLCSLILKPHFCNDFKKSDCFLILSLSK